MKQIPVEGRQHWLGYNKYNNRQWKVERNQIKLQLFILPQNIFGGKFFCQLFDWSTRDTSLSTQTDGEIDTFFFFQEFSSISGFPKENLYL